MVGVDRWPDQAFSAEEFEDPAVDPEPPVSIRSLKTALKRRRRLWLTMALAGLVLGAALHVLLPSKVTAVSKLYLVESASVDPTTAITNDLSLLQTRKVAQTAAGILHLDPNGSLISYKSSAEGTSIVLIKVSAGSAATAVAWNNALAQAFLQVRAQLMSEVTNSDVAALHGEIQSLQSNMQQLSTASSKAAVNQQNLDQAQINSQSPNLSSTRRSGLFRQEQHCSRFGLCQRGVGQEDGHQGWAHWTGCRARPGDGHCDHRRAVVGSGAHPGRMSPQL